jgi:tRNA U34 5-methylaminomethyl-2-thiouridine-forming methyltransferase MnmC
MENFKIVATADGSSSILSERFNSTYHSVHGALQESLHVFIQNGLNVLVNQSEIHLLEIGFGSGLNALLAWNWAEHHHVQIHYTGVEAYPIQEDQLEGFNVGESVNFERFRKLHQCAWEEYQEFSPHFVFRKKLVFWPQTTFENLFDIIWYDAFAPAVQPELWDRKALTSCIQQLRSGGVWVTYSSKGEVRRLLGELGCDVERIAGPPFKRHMLRATKR